MNVQESRTGRRGGGLEERYGEAEPFHSYLSGWTPGAISWDALYENVLGSNGWQVFVGRGSITARYIRVVGMSNTANEHFHIVELEGHDDVPPQPAEPQLVAAVESIKAILDVLKERGAERPCPRCGAERFTLIKGFFNQPVQSELNTFSIGGPAACVCANCGWISQHALGVLGLLPIDSAK